MEFVGVKCEKANPFQTNTLFAALGRMFFSDALKGHARNLIALALLAESKPGKATSILLTSLFRIFKMGNKAAVSARRFPPVNVKVLKLFH